MVQNVNIRSATPQDIENIASVHVESWRKSYDALLPHELLNKVNVEKRIEYWTRLFDQKKFKHLFVAEQESKIIGFVDAWYSVDKPSEAKIEHLYILKECQGQGVGQQLMEKLFAALDQDEISFIELDTLKEGPSGRFYKKLGGIVTNEEVVNLFGHDVDTYHFVWNR